MSTPNADAWELAGFPGRLDVAAYLTRITITALEWNPPDHEITVSPCRAEKVLAFAA